MKELSPGGKAALEALDEIKKILVQRNTTRNINGFDITDYATTVNGKKTFFPLIKIKAVRLEAQFRSFPDYDKETYIDDLRDLVNYAIFELAEREADEKEKDPDNRY